MILALQARQSNSLDWRMGCKINTDWQDTSRSAEHLLSRSPRTPTTKYVNQVNPITNLTNLI